ncbi:hypothetical protein [Rufibacter hautae]|uniref:Uncharacterized protein n=1 Tax=Rufibacter hautae TaxID=2595005 RepID=A0A5B6TF37_9BACT|nr:hypothetical protein [Rufibacter hautae]KAA3439224.1 hypothetical protein FOA19_00625 [Rufibacter hautae]
MDELWEFNPGDLQFAKIVEMVELHYLLERFNVRTYLNEDGLVEFNDTHFVGDRNEYAFAIISYYLQREHE